MHHAWFKTTGDAFTLVHDEDLQVFEAYCVQYKKKYGVKIIAFSIMSNHLHMMLENSEVDPDAISCFLRDVKREFAKYYNIAYGRKGAFWQYGFKTKEIRDGRQFVINIVYILNNPVRARLCRNAGEYAHGAFPLVTEKDVILQMKRTGRLLSETDVQQIIARSKRVGYAGRLPEEFRVARGLGWDLSDKRLMPLVHQGRREYKRRGPMPYWHPEDNRRTLDRVPRLMAPALLDRSTMFGKLDPKELLKLCHERSGITEESWERVGGMKVIFESSSRRICKDYQVQMQDSLPPNAQLPRSIIETGRGTWAVVSLHGRPRRQE
ncbi:MAG: transposase [Planctomycetota bacterium]